jgi:ATP-dependent helicase HrpB
MATDIATIALPIDDALPSLRSALNERDAAVLVAPPGAGKTTRVPLALAGEPWAATRRLLVLEPRRLAARAAAERMAATLGEAVGQTVGYRVRFGSRISRATRIEVVTEGIFTNLILDDPALEGVAAVLFDEFHERSLEADLGLALARDAQQGLRPDLKLLVMSATLDGAGVARLLGDAPVVESEGRAFPVDTRYVARDPSRPIDVQVAETVMRALRVESGSILVFLPGAAEIRRCETQLRERLADPAIDVVPLFGALEADLQDRAIAPASAGRRKIVLATSIAETSLTIEGVRIVIDSGLARVPRYEPAVGLTRLETVRVSRASADQRRGRAGRTAPGVCYRLWEEAQTGSLEPFARPEILAADLSGFVLDLALWGVSEPEKLAFLDPPPRSALTEARALLRDLGAIDASGRITEEGRRLHALPLAPRLARMVVDASARGFGRLATEIALILTERGIGGTNVDLGHRLDELRRDRSRRAVDARRAAQRWLGGETTRPQGDDAQEPSPGSILALAYPDRIAKNRGDGRFLLANGRGAAVDQASPLAREAFLAVAEVTGTATQGRIVLAARISLSEIESCFASQIETREETYVDPQTLALRARQRRGLGALALAERPVPVISDEASARVLTDGVFRAGLDRLPWSKAISQWRDRVNFLRAAEGDEWPDLSDQALTARAEQWMVPALFGKTALAELSSEDLFAALLALVPHALRRRLEVEAPTHFDAPSGSRVPIDYEAPEGPKLSIRLQELFGLDRHPTIAGGRIALVVELLSPAHRPVQVTRDLPGFWRGSYAAVRSDMRGRYPRHPWPDDPLSAPATRRAKPRGQ